MAAERIGAAICRVDNKATFRGDAARAVLAAATWSDESNLRAADVP